MILELDCGNSFIKWRVLRADGVTPVEGGVVSSDSDLLVSLSNAEKFQLKKCRLVSVRTPEETDSLVASLVDVFGCR